MDFAFSVLLLMLNQFLWFSIGHIRILVCIDDMRSIIYDVCSPSHMLPVSMDHREISGQLWEVKQQSNNLLMNNEST